LLRMSGLAITEIISLIERITKLMRQCR
jgi:hypothetical protein